MKYKAPDALLPENARGAAVNIIQSAHTSITQLAWQHIVEPACAENLSQLETIRRLDDEENVSHINSTVKRRITAAHFSEVNSIDQFDFGFDPLRKKLKARCLALHKLDFLEKETNPLFIENTGTGKSFLSCALAFKAYLETKQVVFVSAPKNLNELLHDAEIHDDLQRIIIKHVKAGLLVIDDFACLSMDTAQAALAFQIISERYDYRCFTAIPPIVLSRSNRRCFPIPSKPRYSTSASPSAATDIHSLTSNTALFYLFQLSPWVPVILVIVVPNDIGGNTLSLQHHREDVSPYPYRAYVVPMDLSLADIAQ